MEFLRVESFHPLLEQRAIEYREAAPLTVYHLIDALPAAFFGLLGIWAAVVRRHWFLRFSVVCAFLLVCLLIPAYEVVLEFGIAIALILSGVWLARGRRHEPFRFSLESALLAMVVVAIGSAVVGKAPEFGWANWFNLCGTGGAIAIISLLCLWLVFGKTSLWRRLPLGLLAFLVFTVLYYFSSATHYLLIQPEWSFAWLERLWQQATAPEMMLFWGIGHCIPTSLLGFTTLCSVLVLARGSRWFTVLEGDLPSHSDRRTQAARLGLVALMLCLFSPLCYLFYRLMTPMPYPVVEMPADNGWDDFVAAGNTSDSENDYRNALQAAWKGTQAEAKAAIDHVLPALDRIELGMNRGKFLVDPVCAKEEKLAVIRACYCLQAHFFYAERFGTPKDLITQLAKKLHFIMLVNKDAGLEGRIRYHVEIHTRLALIRMMACFNTNQCQQIAELLCQYDNERGSLKNRLYYQRLADENCGWLKHVQLLMQEWSGEDPYADDSQQYLNNVRHTRMLIVQFALQRYFLDNQRLPENLTELVPDYLPMIPVDPHTNKPLHYQHLWGGYALSTLDENAKDQALVTGPAAPYLWQRLQESWQCFRATVLQMKRD